MRLRSLAAFQLPVPGPREERFPRGGQHFQHTENNSLTLIEKGTN